MAIEHEQQYQLRTGDFDTRDELMPASVLDIFQDIAGISADQTPGMAKEDMDRAGLYWVVTQTTYEVLRTPPLHERVIAKTWPLAPTRMGFQREYTIRDLAGQVLVRGTSQWMMMDKATRSMVNTKTAYDWPDDFSAETNFEKRPRRIRGFEHEGGDEGHLVAPGYSAIDFNGHVNNTKYANFFLDAWDPARDEHIRTFQIEYRHEIREGERVRVFVGHEGDAVLGEGADEDGEPRFFCRVGLA